MKYFYKDLDEILDLDRDVSHSFFALPESVRRELRSRGDQIKTVNKLKREIDASMEAYNKNM